METLQLDNEESAIDESVTGRDGAMGVDEVEGDGGGRIVVSKELEGGVAEVVSFNT